MVGIQERRQLLHQAVGKPDQAHRSEILFLDIPQSSEPPIFLLGGMGPLAGLEGLEAACQYWGNRRPLFLYQACHIPCRTSAILAERSGNINDTKQLVQALGQAIAQVRHYFENSEIRLLVLCNTAHYFLPAALLWLKQHQPELAARIALVSLPQAGVAGVKTASPHCVVPLSTTGTRIAGIYTQALTAADLPFVLVSEEAQELLHQAIYVGIKATDIEKALHWGNAFFQQLLEQAPTSDVLLAGCTEIPPLCHLLLEQGIVPVQQFLATTKIINPLEIAIAQL
jgi:aspartate/glutamate racemase